MKQFLDICKILVDAELMHNLSSLDNCDSLHFLRSNWSNMELIQVPYPDLILFILLISFIYFGMYFLSDISPIYNFPSTILAPKKILQKLVTSYHCVALVLRFEVDDFASLNEHQYFDKQRVFYIGGMYYIRVVFNLGM